MPITELVELFLQSHRTGGKSAKTVKFYGDRLKKFVKRFGAREFAALTLAEINSYLAEAAIGKGGKVLSDSTRHHDIVALEQLQKFAKTNREIKKKLFKKLQKPRIGRRERLPTPAETASILAAAGPEFRRIYSALRQTGARPGELCGTQIANIEKLDGQRAIVLKKHKTAAKTGKPRVIPIGAHFARLVSEAIGERAEGFIFLTPTGRPWTTGNLSATYRHLRDKAGLPKDLCLYLARHEHASALCEAGVNLKAVAEALGHADVGTTQRYVKVKLDKITQNQDLFETGEPPAPPPAAPPNPATVDAEGDRPPPDPAAGSNPPIT